MTRTLRGKIRGKTMELDEDLGVVDGQEVEVQITMDRPRKRPPAHRLAGSPAAEQNSGLAGRIGHRGRDRILEEIYQDRKRDIRRDLPE